jgi:hypothetical protein
MNVEYERTFDDLIEFNLYHIAHSPSLRKQILMTRVFYFLLMTITSGSVVYLVGRESNPLPYILCILAGVVTFIVYPVFERRSMTGRLKKVLAEGDNKAILGPQMISLTPEGLFCKTPASEEKLNWSIIDKVAQNEKYIFLYISSTNAFMIPKKAFSSGTLQKEFLAYVDAHRAH